MSWHRAAATSVPSTVESSAQRSWTRSGGGAMP